MRTYYDPQDPRRAQHAHSAPPRQARRRKRRRGSPALCLALALFLIGGALSLGRLFTPPPLEQVSPAPSQSVEEETGDVGDDLQAQLQALSQEKPRARDILSNLEDYPRELLELAVRNPETVDFVADYPQEKDRVPAETVEEAERGTIPLLLQWDPRWGLCPVRGRAHGPQRLRPHRPVHGDLRSHRGRNCHPPTQWPSTPRRWGTMWTGWAPVGSSCPPEGPASASPPGSCP